MKGKRLRGGKGRRVVRRPVRGVSVAAMIAAAGASLRRDGASWWKGAR